MYKNMGRVRQARENEVKYAMKIFMFINITIFYEHLKMAK